MRFSILFILLLFHFYKLELGRAAGGGNILEDVAESVSRDIPDLNMPPPEDVFESSSLTVLAAGPSSSQALQPSFIAPEPSSSQALTDQDIVWILPREVPMVMDSKKDLEMQRLFKNGVANAEESQSWFQLFRSKLPVGTKLILIAEQAQPHIMADIKSALLSQDMDAAKVQVLAERNNLPQIDSNLIVQRDNMVFDIRALRKLQDTLRRWKTESPSYYSWVQDHNDIQGIFGIPLRTDRNREFMRGDQVSHLNRSKVKLLALVSTPIRGSNPYRYHLSPKRRRARRFPQDDSQAPHKTTTSVPRWRIGSSG